jgi:HTH-type transcriptional regulator, transcriptional repressor of NAD biosynthesis genes
LYKNGLIIGKFMPLHTGHIALIEYALQHCESVSVLLCISDSETMPGDLRLQWLHETFAERQAVRIVRFDYKEADLPSTSESSRQISALWAATIAGLHLACDVVVAGEPYGEYVAENLGIHSLFVDRKLMGEGISATALRNNPLLHWAQIPAAVRPCYALKIVVCGTESTGKTTLSAALAKHYRTEYVAEAGRDLVDKTEDATFEDLEKILQTHTERIIAQSKTCNGLLFLDTDCIITASYSEFLFQKKLNIPSFISKMNQAALYLYLDNDVPFVQDGTRLPALALRNALDESHRKCYAENGIALRLISGCFEGRMAAAVGIIDGFL